MALKFRVVKKKVLNGVDKDTVKNYAMAKTSGVLDCCYRRHKLFLVFRIPPF